MLHECIRYENITKILLYSDIFYEFFKYVNGSKFDIAMDAFKTFKELLTNYKILAKDFLESNFDSFFTCYHQKLIKSENFATRKESMKFLGELLIDKHNFSVMIQYISNPDHLKLIMNILKEESKAVLLNLD